MSETFLWDLSRATGVLSLVLLTATVLLGAITARRRQPRGTSSTVIMVLHRNLSLGMSVFLLAHIVTALLDDYVPLDLVDAVVPFVSSYETLAVGIGTLAFDLVIAVVVTSLLRRRMPDRVWRGVHLTAHALWPVAVLHGVLLSTADQPVLRWTSVLCGVVGIAALTWRLLASNADRDRRRLIDQGEWA